MKHLNATQGVIKEHRAQKPPARAVTKQSPDHRAEEVLVSELGKPLTESNAVASEAYSLANAQEIERGSFGVG